MIVSYGNICILPENNLAKHLFTMDADDDIPEKDKSVSAIDKIGSLLTTATENLIKDIGMDLVDQMPVEAGDLDTEEKEVVDMIERTVGTGKVARQKL